MQSIIKVDFKTYGETSAFRQGGHFYTSWHWCLFYVWPLKLKQLAHRITTQSTSITWLYMLEKVPQITCFCKSNFVSANSHTLWMALTPVDLTHQSNISRTISSAWVTQIQKNWPLTHNEWWKFNSISTKIIIPKRCWIMTLCPNKIKTCWDFCLSDSLGIAHRSSKHLWTFSAMFWCQHKSSVVDGTFLETPVTVKMKISCLWLRKHWQVPIC